MDLLALTGAPLLIGTIVTGLTVILFGLVPSIGALRLDFASPLRADTRSGTEGRRLRVVRRALVAAQLALAVVVLAGAGLLVRSLARLTGLDVGYSTEHLSFLSVSLPWRSMLEDCRPRAASMSHADSTRWGKCFETRNYDAHDQIMAKLRAVPEIVSVSPTTAPPFLGSSVWMGKIVAERQSEAEGKGNPWFGLDLVGPEYFRTMNVPILEGRGFTEADREGAPHVAVVTQGVARRLWPNEDALGKRFHSPGQDDPDSLVTIVGVVPDLHFRVYREATPTVFRPYRQVYAQGYFVTRTRGAPSLAVLRSVVQDAGTGIMLLTREPMDAFIAPQLAGPRFDALLLSIFACSALLIAAIGLYGIMASAVSQQTRELGVRMALGATPSLVRRMVLGQALAISAVGVALGLIGAAAGTRLLTSLLFEISAFDPVTLIGVSVLLLLVALFAAYLPARRATRIDPARALRAE